MSTPQRAFVKDFSGSEELPPEYVDVISLKNPYSFSSFF